MKTKKFLILSVLITMLMLMAGCNYDVTKEFKESQKVAEEFLTTKGYEPPKGCSIRYLNEYEKQLCVNVGKSLIVFDIVEGKPKMRTIEDSRNVSISKSYINEIKEVGQEFLNTAGYHIPEEYSITYSEDKKQLEVSRQQDIKTTVVLNILDDEVEISEVWYYEDESSKYAPLIVICIWVGILIMVIISCEVESKK